MFIEDQAAIWWYIPKISANQEYKTIKKILSIAAFVYLTTDQFHQQAVLWIVYILPSSLLFHSALDFFLNVWQQDLQ